MMANIKDTKYKLICKKCAIKKGWVKCSCGGWQWL